MHRAQSQLDLVLPFETRLNIFVGDKGSDAVFAQLQLQFGHRDLVFGNVAEEEPEHSALPQTLYINRCSPLAKCLCRVFQDRPDCDFSKEWERDVVDLREGDKVAVVGQFSKILWEQYAGTRYMIVFKLKDCRLSNK